MKLLLMPILIFLFTSAPTYTGPETDYFPLREGDQWIYHDYIEMQINGKIEKIDALHTVKVLSVEFKDNFKIAKLEDNLILEIAKLEEIDLRGERTFFYIVDDDKIYRIESKEELNKAITKDGKFSRDVYLEYVFPLQENSKWGDPDQLKRKDKRYFYYVDKIEDVTVPAGTFKNCFKIVHNTLPDETIKWFCPYVGIVRMEYHHHGTIVNHISELKEIGNVK